MNSRRKRPLRAEKAGGGRRRRRRRRREGSGASPEMMKVHEPPNMSFNFSGGVRTASHESWAGKLGMAGGIVSSFEEG